ncbi:MAG: Na+/H+ antiporter NhaA [Kiloniellales bacterium]|nr:Na+/H+ antiporter NhaA [Kiloniellales bacterium]
MIAIREFLRHESASGVILMLAAVLALVFDNSPLAWLYDGLLDTPLAIQVGALKIAKPLLLWINDGLMAIFFLLVGLEIKREVLEGELSSIDKAALPAVAAVGGMAMPAAVFVAINWGNAETLKGWAIPAATDIAFALGILALLGTRVPLALKVFLLALAIIDDLGAIVIIALFYTDGLSTTALSLAAIGIVGLILLNRLGVTRLTPYVLVGIFMWVCVLKSGVHATLAGVALAFAIPLRVKGNAETAPLRLLEHELHPWVAYGVMPIFAFANAGVPLGGLSFADLLAPLPLGIAAGLFIGKQVGVMSFVWIAVRIGLCRLPPGISWAQIYGVALLAGIGFTMSLFIGTLAFEDPSQASGVRLGVLCGSITSAICGYLLLRLRSEAPNPARA